MPDSARERNGVAEAADRTNPDNAGTHDRRREMRLPCDHARVLIELSGQPDPVPGEIVDVSKSGLFLRLGASVPGGELLRANLPHMVIAGKVCYCRPNDGGSFDTGIEILDVQYPPKSEPPV